MFEAGNSELAQQEAIRSITIYAPHGTQALGVLHLSGNPQYLLARIAGRGAAHFAGL